MENINKEKFYTKQVIDLIKKHGFDIRNMEDDKTKLPNFDMCYPKTDTINLFSVIYRPGGKLLPKDLIVLRSGFPSYLIIVDDTDETIKYVVWHDKDCSLVLIDDGEEVIDVSDKKHIYYDGVLTPISFDEFINECKEE